MAGRFIFDRIDVSDAINVGAGMALFFIDRQNNNKLIRVLYSNAIRDPELSEALNTPNPSTGMTPIDVINKLAPVIQKVIDSPKKVDYHRRMQAEQKEAEIRERWARYGTPQQRLARSRAEALASQEQQSSSKLPFILAGIAAAGLLAFALTRRSKPSSGPLMLPPPSTTP
jgi:hypothetical protein